MAGDGTPTPAKKKFSLPLYIVIIIAVVVLALAGAGLKFFVLKPKATTKATTLAVATTATSATTPTAASGSATTPRPILSSSDDPEMASWQGSVVGANGSDTFFINKAGTRTQVELDGVEMPGLGALCSEMERQARGIVTGTVRVEPVTVEHGINQCSAKVTLVGGRDAAEALAAAGWVLPANNAPEKIRKLAAEAESASRGMHRSEYDRPPWTNQ
jgi:endonuclease YncB( thermonuclease family)